MNRAQRRAARRQQGASPQEWLRAVLPLAPDKETADFCRWIAAGSSEDGYFTLEYLPGDRVVVRPG